MSPRYTLTRFFNALWVYVLCVVLTGAYLYQFLKAQSPCPLCELQRLAIISVAIGPLLNLKFGIKPAHYAWSLLSSLFGAGVALRQIGLHICPTFRQWGIPVFGLQLYTWSFLVFACSILGAALLLALYRPKDSEVNPPLSLFESTAFAYLGILTLANVVTTFLDCGFGPCTG